MPENAPTLLILHGGTAAGPAEKTVAAARVEEARGSIRAALAAGFGRAIVATDVPHEFDSGTPAVLIEPDAAGVPFDFATRLASVIERHRVRRPVVMGAGALPLAGPSEFAAVASSLAGNRPVCVTNNFYSSDLTGWYPADLLNRIDAPARDNSLPRRLREQAGADVTILARTTATQFDLDTPTDVAILGVLRGTQGPFPLLEEGLRRVMLLLCDREAEILVAGRVGSASWNYLEGQTACRVRIISEERGLATAPDGHTPRSVLGFIAESRGPEGLVDVLESLCDGAFIDTRVVLGHARVQASREDRFQSDLLQPEAIESPWLRELTRAAARGRRIIFGGHSLVSGGLMALNDAAWEIREAAEKS